MKNAGNVVEKTPKIVVIIIISITASNIGITDGEGVVEGVVDSDSQSIQTLSLVFTHKSILSRAKWLCRYGVLYDAALDYLIGTFGRHGISEDDIRGMVINNYNANRESFGVSRMELYSRKERGVVYRNRMLREKSPFQ